MDINAFPRSIEDIFHGVTTRYIVPHYQRTYDWTVGEHIAELWEDISSAAASGSDYFLGSVVLNKGEQRQNQFQIVDGQQRLTTLTVLLAAIRDLAQLYQANPTSEWFGSISHPETHDDARICWLTTHTKICHISELENYYLVINDHDQETLFDRIQKPQQERDIPPPSDVRAKIRPRDHRLIKAQKFFRTQIHESFLQWPDGFQRLKAFALYVQTKLQLLQIVVGSDVDAYLLFESLNDRGLELSIDDLVKNRVLIACGNDSDKRSRLLSKWNAMAQRLNESRFKMRDYLRFYWSAFHGACTAKQLYKRIRDEVSPANVQDQVEKWHALVDYFCSITNPGLRFPSSELQYPSLDACYAEMAQLGYSVHLPLFLRAKRERPALLEALAPRVCNYLVRVITVGVMSAKIADSKMREAIGAIEAQKSDRDVLAVFDADTNSSDDVFRDNISRRRFEDAGVAKYLLAKIHLDRYGQSHQLGSDTELEHVLPQNRSAWPDFDCGEKPKEDYIFALGNLTLLEKKLNASVSDQPFERKVAYYKQRRGRAGARSCTAIPMTYELHKQYEQALLGDPERGWDAERIRQRTASFANEAVRIFSNESAIDETKTAADVTHQGSRQRRRSPTRRRGKKKAARRRH